MHLFLPLLPEDQEEFRRCAIQIGFDEFVMHKFMFTMQHSDLDIYQLMHDERLSLLLYGWEICEIHMQNSSNSVANKNYTPTKNVQTVMKWLARYSLDVWLSREWDSSDIKMCQGLLYCMRRVVHILVKIPEVGHLNWDDMFKWELKPWAQPYVSNFLIASSEQKLPFDESIEEIEQPACKQDIDYLKEENIFMIMARLVKMIDSFYLEGVKQLSMRVIAAWNAIFERAKDIPGNMTPQIPAEFKLCVINICHIYLMMVYEMDSNRGFVIDNMLNNIRFYHQSFLECKYEKPFAAIAPLSLTPARFIALTCINLNVSINEFLETFSKQVEEKSFSTLFGMISQSYISYILGNQLMEMNNMNEEHFHAHIERYKHIFNIYIKEREISEMYLKDQLVRRGQQEASHTMSQIVKIPSDIESKFCKGNRSCNMGNCETGSEDEYVQAVDAQMVRDKNMDAIFENIPNNEEILNYVYQMLAERTYDGWHCAKIVLLLKIIGIEVNSIETWRYHPGLTTDFMLGLETKLSKHFEDLALLFHDHFFFEQEFWLTAFYLNPIRKYYTSVIRCGMRFQRIQQHVDGEGETHADAADKSEKHAKYGLLSSTIDVKEIVRIRNHDIPNADYDALSKSLSSLKLSEQTVKDLLTVTFLPRNKSFAWAVNWEELRKRCKKLVKIPELKRHLVELNMAEANDRLKYLNIDYEKYKNRPQLDYGSIEEGYGFTGKEQYGKDAHDGDDDDDDDDDDANDEELAAGTHKSHLGFDEYDDDDDDGNDDDDDDDDDDEDKQFGSRKAKRTKRSQSDREIEKRSCKEIEQLLDIFSTGTRRTRARTAAVLASVNMTSERSRKEENILAEPEPKIEAVSEQSASKPVETINNPTTDAAENVVKRNLKELLQERSVYSNATPGFEPFPDIWDFDAQMLQTVDKTTTILTETQNFMEKFSYLDTTIHKNILPVKLPSPLTVAVEVGLHSPHSAAVSDATTLSATEYDIHEVIEDIHQNNSDNNDVSLNSEAAFAMEKEVVPNKTNEDSVGATCLDKEEHEVVIECTESTIDLKDNKQINNNSDINPQVTDEEMDIDEPKVSDLDVTEKNSNEIMIETNETTVDKEQMESDMDIDAAENIDIQPEDKPDAINLSNKSDTIIKIYDIQPEDLTDATNLSNKSPTIIKIYDSMEVNEDQAVDSTYQAEEPSLPKSMEESMEEDQHNVVIMLADLAAADEISENALDLMSDAVMKSIDCTVETETDDTQEELNPEVQKFTYDDGEENSQSNDVFETTTTIKQLCSDSAAQIETSEPLIKFATSITEDVVEQNEAERMVEAAVKAAVATQKGCEVIKETGVVTEEAQEEDNVACENVVATEETQIEIIVAAPDADVAIEEDEVENNVVPEDADVATVEAKEENDVASQDVATVEAQVENDVASQDVVATVEAQEENNIVPEDAVVATEEAQLENNVASQDVAVATEEAKVENNVPSQDAVLTAIEFNEASEEVSKNSTDNTELSIKTTEVHSTEFQVVGEVLNTEPTQTEALTPESKDKPDKTNEQHTDSSKLSADVESKQEESDLLTAPDESQESREDDKETAIKNCPVIPDEIKEENKSETKPKSPQALEDSKEQNNTDATSSDKDEINKLSEQTTKIPNEQKCTKAEQIKEESSSEGNQSPVIAQSEITSGVTKVNPKILIKRFSMSGDSRSPIPHEVKPTTSKRKASSSETKFPSKRGEEDSSKVEEQQQKVSNFATKDVVIRIKRLKVTDCIELRQPRVFINRVKKDSMDSELASSVKSNSDSNSAPSSTNTTTTITNTNNTTTSINTTTTTIVNTNTTSTTTATTTANTTSGIISTFNLRPHRRLNFRRHYSPSSTASDDDLAKSRPKLKYARKQTAKRRYIPNGKPIGRPRKLVATPRSPSGLKMRISSSITVADGPATRCENDNIELIHISSSSSSLEIIESSDEELHQLPTNLCSIIDPLYEEEIILCD